MQGYWYNKMEKKYQEEKSGKQNQVDYKAAQQEKQNSSREKKK